MGKNKDENSSIINKQHIGKAMDSFVTGAAYTVGTLCVLGVSSLFKRSDKPKPEAPDREETTRIREEAYKEGKDKADREAKDNEIKVRTNFQKAINLQELSVKISKEADTITKYHKAHSGWFSSCFKPKPAEKQKHLEVVKQYRLDVSDYEALHKQLLELNIYHIYTPKAELQISGDHWYFEDN